MALVDVVSALTESVNAADYLKKLRKRAPELAAHMGTNCPYAEMLTPTGEKSMKIVIVGRICLARSN